MSGSNYDQNSDVWRERGKDGKKLVYARCIERFLYFCNMFMNYVNDLFNYVCDDILIDDCGYMHIECKWQVIWTDSRTNDFNMWVPQWGKITHTVTSGHIGYIEPHKIHFNFKTS